MVLIFIISAANAWAFSGKRRAKGHKTWFLHQQKDQKEHLPPNVFGEQQWPFAKGWGTFFQSQTAVSKFSLKLCVSIRRLSPKRRHHQLYHRKFTAEGRYGCGREAVFTPFSRAVSAEGLVFHKRRFHINCPPQISSELDIPQLKKPDFYQARPLFEKTWHILWGKPKGCVKKSI